MIADSPGLRAWLEGAQRLEAGPKYDGSAIMPKAKGLMRVHTDVQLSKFDLLNSA